MIIGGLQKTTLLDFPGRISALVFTRGCNFHCPYCHNPDLLTDGQGAFSVPEVLDFLAKRRKVLEGLVISGGEPCLHDDLPDFCRQVKDLGYTVKLDSNGGRPDMLERLLAEGLLDYIAMDVKADPAAYPEELCSATLRPGVMRSIDIIRNSGLEHEFRVTCVYPFVSDKLVDVLGECCGKSLVFFQSARLENVLAQGFFKERGRALSGAEMENLVQAGRRLGLNWRLR